jgi:hypothetical protein
VLEIDGMASEMKLFPIKSTDVVRSRDDFLELGGWM